MPKNKYIPIAFGIICLTALALGKSCSDLEKKVEQPIEIKEKSYDNTFLNYYKDYNFVD